MKVLKVISAVMLSAIASFSFAQVANEGYVADSSGQVVRTGTNLCVRTSQWTPALAIEGCDPVAAKKATPVTLNSDVLFAFDSAVLTPAGKAALDAVVSQVGGNVIVVGHTDRIGPAAYNKTLSENRAQSVARYLSVAAKANYAVSGVGSTQPTGKTAQCTGAVSQKLIDCLAPDRRVTLTIVK
jgi:OOP family OmpA-OmpF porin